MQERQLASCTRTAGLHLDLSPQLVELPDERDVVTHYPQLIGAVCVCVNCNLALEALDRLFQVSTLPCIFTAHVAYPVLRVTV